MIYCGPWNIRKYYHLFVLTCQQHLTQWTKKYWSKYYKISMELLEQYFNGIKHIRHRGFKVSIHDAYSDEIELPFAFAQGSCTGPYLFILYCSTVQYTVPRTITLLGYSDDHALKDTFKAKSRDDENRCLVGMEECLKDFNTWMCKNRLQMNNAKTEFIYFGYRQILSLWHIKNRCKRHKN